MITRTPVTSSNLAEVGYGEDSRTLEVLFTNGGHYVYANVPPELHQQLMAAESIGSFFAQHIRSHPELYPFTKLEPDTSAAPAPATVPPAVRKLTITEITIRRVFNLGNYESYAVEATAAVNAATGEDATVSAQELKAWVLAQDPRPRQRHYLDPEA